jgi:DHA1 family bicyclomycin/chloramphenicol resistance-like MFS transporter
MEEEQKARRAGPILALVVGSTLVGLMGTDLVLPAIPHLPETLGGSAAAAQMVLAFYVAGGCVGLILFGLLSDHAPTPRLFIGSLLATAFFALACSHASSVEMLAVLRLFHGAASVGPAVFAPAIIKTMFEEARAMRAIGLLGSIEALAPALAPILGVYLYVAGGWRLSFDVIAVLAVALAIILLMAVHLPQVSRRHQGSYLALFGNPVFLRYVLSQALVMGGLLTFVFGMPAVFVRALGGSLGNFIVMQISGIITFMIAANMSSRLVARFGAERVIGIGTLIMMGGAAAQAIYALCHGRDALMITVFFVPVNFGLGLRGPPSVYRAIAAAAGDDARGSALLILAIFGAAALGTALTSPWIEQGTAPLAGIAFAFHALALLCLLIFPALKAEAVSDEIGQAAGDENADERLPPRP